MGNLVSFTFGSDRQIPMHEVLSQLESNRNHGDSHTYILVHRDLAFEVLNNVEQISHRRLFTVLAQLFYYAVIEGDDTLFRLTLDELKKNKRNLYMEYFPDYIFMNSFYPNFVPYNLLQITNERPITILTELPFDIPRSIYQYLRILFFLKPYTLDKYYITLVTRDRYEYLPLTENMCKMILNLI